MIKLKVKKGDEINGFQRGARKVAKVVAVTVIVVAIVMTIGILALLS